jgi:hypothetical protein
VVGRDPESNEIISVAIYCNDCQEATEYMRLKPVAKTRLTAICGGGDWADASVDYLQTPIDMDLHSQRSEHDRWYREEYRPNLDKESAVPYIPIVQWLINNGARRATDNEISEWWSND